ncbi:glycosyltransferase family 2 protein [Acuticoccus sp.]|uniref:glycosyltransferase family 2 protein n=1 Tax=Acuticoccus sp. TaxID=1904378 RepID=UPI003B51620D
MPSPAADVTVAIAAHNAASTIRAAVDSALAQERVRVEVIVVDDASQDGTAQAARAVGHGAVSVIALPANVGPGGARNAAFLAARGRWVAVLDADDTFAPDRLARMIALAEREAADVVVDNLEVVGPDRPSHPMFARGPLARPGVLTLAAFVRGNHPFTGAFTLGYVKPVVRRELVERTGASYDTSLRIGEDYVFLADLLAAGARCVVDPTPGYRYVRHAASTSARLDAAHVAAMAAADERFVARHPAAQLAPLVRERRRALERAEAFVTALEAIKQRDVAGAALPLVRRPLALWHFRFPVTARARRLSRWVAGRRRQAD